LRAGVLELGRRPRPPAGPRPPRDHARPARRGDISEDRSWIGHDDNVAAVLAALDADGAGPVVLAGHSLGGATVSQVADRRPDLVARLVYCAAFVLEDGQSADDVMPEQMRAAVSELAATRADRAIPMPWELWRANFIQTAS